jgi:hypothetical protein
MKALFITILILGGAFAGYDYFLAPPGEKIIFKALNVESLEPKSSGAQAAPTTTSKGKDKLVLPPLPAVDNSPDPKSRSVADAPPPPSPSGAPSGDAAGRPADANAFVMPKFEPLEALAKGWTMIPKSAFPRQVHLKRAVPFKMSVGSSTMNAGAAITALAFDNGQLNCAPAESSSARAVVALDDTDLKSVLEEGYEKWKVKRIEWLKEAHQRRLAARASSGNAPDTGVDPAQAPARAGDGSYPLLIASLNSGEVNEIKQKNIHSWGDPQTTMIEGKPAWAIKVQFDAETVFGPQPAEAQAIVASGRVKGWFYTGSGEPVP